MVALGLVVGKLPLRLAHMPRSCPTAHRFVVQIAWTPPHTAPPTPLLVEQRMLRGGVSTIIVGKLPHSRLNAYVWLICLVGALWLLDDTLTRN